MNTPALSPIFLDNEPVQMRGEPRPRVEAIIAASGKRPARLEVSWLKSKSGGQARPLRFEEIVDRTAHPTKPIYLVSRERRSLIQSATHVRPPHAEHERSGHTQHAARPADSGASPRPAADPEWKF